MNPDNRKKKVCFGVITEIPNDYTGNYASNELLINPAGDSCIVGANIIVAPPIKYHKLFTAIIRQRRDQTPIDLTKEQIVLCNTPVFHLGEILIIGDNGRTIPDGRKPSKWCVKCEYFDDLSDAINRSEEVYS